MTVKQRTFPIDQDASIVLFGSLEQGTGKYAGLPFGLFNGHVYRSLVRFVNDWTGMTSIVKIELVCRTSSQIAYLFGSSPLGWIRALGAGWTEGGYAIFSSANAVTWTNQPNALTTDQVSFAPGTVERTIKKFDMTTLYKRYAPAALGGINTTNRGLQLRAQDETLTNQRGEFFSRESGLGAMYVLVTYDDNVPPDVPTITSPVNEAYTNTVRGDDVTVMGGYTDPNGDPCTGVRVQVLADSATDAAPGVAVLDSTAATIQGSTWSMYLVGLAHRTYYRVRAQTKDDHGAWSNWSSITTQRFRTNALPDVPVNPFVDPFTLTPHFYGSIQDADAGAYISGARAVVYLDLPGGGGTVLKWDSGMVDIGGTSTRFDLPYAGTQLEWDLGYRLHVQLRDNDQQVGPLGGAIYFTQREPIGPTTMTPNSLLAKQNTLTPVLTVGSTTAFDAWGYEIYAGQNADGSPAGAAIDSFTAVVASTTSANRTIPALPGWGRTYYWRARTRPTGSGSFTAWSPLAQFYVNAEPTNPTSISPGGGTLATQVVMQTLTPTLSAHYEDADLLAYDDKPGERIVEISLALTPFTVVHTNTNAGPPAFTDPMTYAVPGATLANDTSYRHRWRFKDTAGRQGPWSEYHYFRVSLPPTATTPSPASAATITDPTPTLGWTYASPGGHVQTTRRVLVWHNTTGVILFDTGLQKSAAASVALPAGLLDSPATYAWSVDVYDDQGLKGTMATATFTTNFGTPPDPTGLLATPDSTRSAVDLAWDASTVTAGEFAEWRLYRQNNPDGGFDLIATIPVQATLAYTDYGAALGPPVTYRLTQYNGWRESGSSDATTALGAVMDGAWVVVVPGQDRYLLELPMVTAGPKTYEQPSERWAPLDRVMPVVEHGPVHGAQGSLSMLLPPEDWHLEGRLREIADWPDPCYLKSRYGDSWLVRLGTINTSPAAFGMQELSVTYQQVGV